MTRAPSRFVYVPVEITVRELDAKLLVALAALLADCEVIIGQKWLIESNVPFMPPGLILSKTMTRRDGVTSQLAKRFGYVTAAIDEEMPGLVASRHRLRWVDADTVAATDLLLCIGDDHRAALAERFPEVADRCRVVGNPRWDLYRPELRDYYRPLAEEIRRRFGRFILVNTNSGIANSAKGPAEEVIRRQIKAGKVDPTSEYDRHMMADRARFREANFAAMKEILRRLPERFPEHQIVLRPHPNEAVATWRDYVRDLPRIHIDQEHPVAVWIMAAEALVHTDCTTGVEAYALARPAVCVEPVETETSQNYLSHYVNPIAADVESALDCLEHVLSTAFAPYEYPAEFAVTYSRFITASTGELATVRTMNECRALLPELGGATRTARARWRPGRGYRNRIRMKAHNRKLMPPMTVSQIAERMHRLADLAGFGSALEGLQVSVCGDNVFHLHRSNAVRYWSGDLAALNWTGLPRPAGISIRH